jgi:hypothetical protein
MPQPQEGAALQPQLRWQRVWQQRCFGHRCLQHRWWPQPLLQPLSQPQLGAAAHVGIGAAQLGAAQPHEGWQQRLWCCR